MTYVGRGVDAISNVEKLDNITFDGSTTYNLTKSSVAFTPAGKNNILISINGVIQQGNFTVAGATIIFDFSPTSNDTCNFIMHYGTGVLNTPADSSVNMAQLGASGTKSSSTFLAGDNSFKAIPSSTADGYFGSLSAKDLGVGLHIKSGDSGASVDGGGDELVIEGSGASGMSILSATNATGGIFFGDSGGNARSIVKYDHSTDLFKIDTAAATALTIDQNGIITKPLQPCFFVHANSQSGVGSGTTDIPFGNERFDLNADFSTPSFTAPVTGKYAFQFSIRVVNCQAGGNVSIYYQVSNAEIRAWRQDSDGDAGTYETADASLVIDMDANDTCKLQVNSSTDSDFILDGGSFACYFSGYLVA